jgi:hypothetical protein
LISGGTASLSGSFLALRSPDEVLAPEGEVGQMKKVPLALLACGVLAAASAASAHAGMVAYGTDRTSTLYQFDPMTGSVTSIGPLGIGPVTALATDPVTKILYTDPGGGERFSTPVSGCLYTVDRATGAATLVGCDPNQGGRDPIAGPSTACASPPTRRLTTTKCTSAGLTRRPAF